MKKFVKRAIAASLVLGMTLQFSEAGIAFAAEAADKALNPAEHIALSVPETLQDGNNYVFIRESKFEIGEKSGDKLYIPIQRTGDISGEAEVTLKLIDISTRADENYTAEIYKEKVDPTIDKANVAVIDLVVNGDEQIEEEEPTENEIGALVNEAGGADFVDADGNVMAKITATKVDENGEAVGDIAAEDAGTAQAQEQTSETGAVEMVLPEDQNENVNDAAATVAPAQTQDTAASGTSALMEARNAWTGTVSDRQELEQEDTFAQANAGLDKPSSLVADQYPGREFRLHFNADEEAKFLVITPKYSPAADGDCQMMLLLKDQDENLVFPADVEPTPVNIKDEDEKQPITVSMADATVYANDGYAEITVTREGRINSVAGVRIASWEGSAKVGEDYGGVGAKLYFPMGITQRTIKLPVQAGAEEKDFYVKVSPITDVEIGTEITRVVIPVAGTVAGGAASLMDTGSGDPEPLMLSNLWKQSSGVNWIDDTSLHLRTATDREGGSAELAFSLPDSGNYLYDGVTVDHQMYANFCKSRFEVFEVDNDSNYMNFFEDNYTGEGVRGRYNLNYYYGTEKAPRSVYLRATNTKNAGYLWTDDYCDLTVYSVKPIRRNFTVNVEQPEALAFEGMSAEEVLRDYEPYVVNDNLGSTFTVKSNDSFAISRAGSSEMARLVGIDAVNTSNGETHRLVTIDGTTATAVVELNEQTVGWLGSNGYIRWNKEEGEGSPKANQSYSGSITVRPVFDYVSDVTVEVEDSSYGTLTYNDGKKLEKGTHTFHFGDKLIFSTELSETGKNAAMRPSGFKYTAKNSKENETVKETEETYIKDKNIVPLTLNYNYYSLTPTFTEESNQVVVKIADGDIQYFNKEFGLFKDYENDTWQDNGYTYYRIANNVLTNQVYELWAATNDESYVPIWNLSANDTVYSGQAFYLTSGTKAEDNLVTLSAEKSDNNAYYSITGSVYTSTHNLNTGHKANDMVPAQNAIITAGLAGAIADKDGNFTLPVQYAAGGSTIRYTVTYNGVVNVKEAKLYASNMPKKDASYTKTVADASAPTGKRTENVTVSAIPMNIGSVQVEGISQTGAHFKNASVTLRGFVPNVISAIEMNGKELRVKAEVEPGQDYLFGQQTYKENIKGVTFFFKNQVTGEVHGRYSTTDKDSGATWDPETNTAELKIDKFTPDDPTSYTYGDVIMVQLTTDKKVGLAGFSNTDMVYDPVSTGIGVIQDQNYMPQTFDYSIESFAEMMGATPPSNIDDEGKMMEAGTRSSYGRFPFLGEVTAMIKVLTILKKSPYSKLAQNYVQSILPDDDEEAFDPDSENLNGKDGEGARTSVQISVTFSIRETAYGGTRFLLGVVFTYGDSLKDRTGLSKRISRTGKNADGYQGRRNPFKSIGDAFYNFNRYKAGYFKQHTAIKGVELIYEGNKGSALADNFGGPYFTFALMIGFYLDYGYVEQQKTDGSGKTEISHDMVFMGGGGVISINGTIGYTVPIYLGFVPGYINGEAAANANVYLSKSADPRLTLARFNETGKLHGQDFAFNVEVDGQVRAALTVGLGWYKLLGARMTGGVEFELGWSKNMKKWFPGSGSEWGYALDATFSGAVDLVVTSIDLWSFSWPTGVQGGWMDYFRQVRRANLLISMIRKKVTAGVGSAAARNECTKQADALAKIVDTMNDSYADQIKQKTNELKDYAYDNDIINVIERNRINMNKSEGIIGNALDAKILEADETAELPIFRTRDHVASNWVAGKGGFLFGAQKEKGSKKIVEDAAEQTASQMVSLEYTDGSGTKQNENKYLLTFLSDDAGRTRQQASALVYTIYDANSDTWTDPVMVQNDGTADGKPNLIEAGDKLVLSWSSMTADKYKKLRDTVAAEVKAKSGVNDDPAEEDIDNALEAAPTRIMEQMDIFSVTFDKKSLTLGNIDQLTDDEYYDDYPEAVYDDRTGDYIVLYYKTAQDTDSYASENDKLKALLGVSPDPNKTYSLLSYMLYNNRTDEADVNGATHEAGWARDYVFANETDISGEELANHLKTWKGQRFLSSTVKTASGGQADPPIGDLTAANGYNGLATFAFTVDTDFNLSTSEDKELYVQFYDFAQHKTYVPVKLAGETTEKELQEDTSVIERTKAVDVGTPQLIRNGGSTWLFWRENNDGLRYINISELLNARVAKSADVLTKLENGSTVTEDDMDYAVQPDGTFATDPHTNKPYQPNVQKVDFTTLFTPDKLNAADYKVVTDKDDNLYLVWTNIHTYEEGEGEDAVTHAAQEIYASALIKETVSENGGTYTTGRWSKPYRLTTENKYNDGLAIALDKDGGLIIVHNQYSKLPVDSEEKLMELVNNGKMRLIEKDGETYMQGSLLYNSPIDLMVTRFEETGSLEATSFGLSDESPQPGDKVEVTAIIENTGLTNAYGMDVEFYEYKDGARGNKIFEAKYDDLIAVNSVRKADFDWTIPSSGIDGYKIQAVIKEKKNDGTYYDPLESFSYEFKKAAEYELDEFNIEQDGDDFVLSYKLENTGNDKAADGTSLNLRLSLLHSNSYDIEEMYGVDNDLLYSKDLSGMEPNSSDEDEVRIRIPASVFKKFGYDAVRLSIEDADGNAIDRTDDEYISLNAPMNIRLHDGEDMQVTVGETASSALTYDSNVFLDGNIDVRYSVDDPSIASVDAEGNVTAVAEGETNLNATILPLGKTVSVKLKAALSDAAPAIVGAHLDGANAEFTLENADSEGSVQAIAAWYDENGRLLGVKKDAVTVTGNSMYISLPISTDGAKSVKVMALRDDNSPIAEADAIVIGG